MEKPRSHFINNSDEQVWKMIAELGHNQTFKFHESYTEDGNFRKALFIAKSFSMEDKKWQ